MMYYYWKKHGVMPSVFYNMSPGEKVVVRAFYESEMADLKKLAKSKAFPVLDLLKLS